MSIGIWGWIVTGGSSNPSSLSFSIGPAWFTLLTLLHVGNYRFLYSRALVTKYSYCCPCSCKGVGAEGWAALPAVLALLRPHLVDYRIIIMPSIFWYFHVLPQHIAHLNMHLLYKWRGLAQGIEGYNLRSRELEYKYRQPVSMLINDHTIKLWDRVFWISSTQKLIFFHVSMIFFIHMYVFDIHPL